MDLLAGSSSDEDGGKVEFKINKKYAKGYKQWRSKEEKQRLINKYGEVNDTDSGSTTDDGEILTTRQMDKDWLRAYAVVRFKQPRLYKEGERFFKDEAKPLSKKKEKPITLKDYERNFLLEKGGIESDDSSLEKLKGKSYYEEQEEIKKSFKEAMGDSHSDESDDHDDDGLLVKRQLTKEEQVKEDNEYLEWLKGEREELEDKEAAQELAPLKAYWNDPNLSEKERVLRDYVLNNGYMDQEDSDESEDWEGPDHQEEEEFLERAEEYEHKYNFRHEEPGAEEIKSYPRVIEESVRNKDTRRIEKRKRRMEKRRMKKKEREEEVRLLQKLHKEERKEKLRRLKEVASNPTLDYDLDADFNPEEHDKIMQAHFGSEYYGNSEASEKPTFEYDAAIDDDEPGDWWSERLREEDRQPGQDEDAEDCQEVHFNMDVDYDPTEKTRTNGKKKKRKKEKEKNKGLPLFDPSSKSFDEYIDEYLKDKIGSIPFTYREVMPNDFGLSTEEILQAQEKELNAWVSVKKMSQYCSKAQEAADKKKFSARAQLKGKKEKLMPSLFRDPEEPSRQEKKKKTRRTDKGMNEDDFNARQEENPAEAKDIGSHPSQENEEKRKRHKLLSGSYVEKQKRKKRKMTEEAREENNPGPKKKKLANASARVSPSKGKSKMSHSFVQCEEKQDSEGGTELNYKSCKVSAPLPNESVVSREKRKTKKNINSQSFGIGGKGVKVSFEESPLTSKASSFKEDKEKKKKKKKVSFSNFDKSSDRPTVGGESRKKLQQKLSHIMSASRLSKYGIGPDAVKGTKKRKRQKAQQFVEEK